ncbi:MAG: hypothetical protein F4Y60_01920 [Boseongicola sp. SB0664_bin_43]|uniref:Uncharacterized protein n=1 Tax=Boseongicola sp. SB0664_bin_43 TaxID=2604844 RepID=A0A6B0XZH9_9RHOB|nr:hypothetical protein [Boseongicola sp. SB0664_bin_43]
MIVSPLRQALCTDRSQVTKGPDPGRWWSTATLPSGWAVHGFHFFVDWRLSPPAVGDTFLLTRLIDFERGEDSHSVTDGNVLGAFKAAGLRVEFEALRAVCARYGKELVAVLLPEREPAALDDGTPFWIVSTGKDGELTIARSMLRDLKKAIRTHSGGPVRVGGKGLIYGTSAVECLLSLTDAAYPGDADAVLVNTDGHVRYVIEFKKHTLTDPLGKHLANQYYPAPDGRKYQRLHALASELGSSSHGAVSLVMFYYSTKRPLIRLQLVGALGPESLEIKRDSGDVRIDGMTDAEVGGKIMAWMGIRK